MFRGSKVTIVEDRIDTENRDPNLHYYEIRHSDDDWGNPVSIDEAIGVNFFGLLITSSPIKIGPLTTQEQRILAY